MLSERARLRVDVIHGPNLNLLGSREVSLYGEGTLAELNSALVTQGASLGAEVVCTQANGEGALVDHIHASAAAGSAGFVVNLGAYTHTSVALRDALLGVGLPVVEVHLSNVFAREPFRHVSYVADIAMGVVSGFGAAGYAFALERLIEACRAE